MAALRRKVLVPLATALAAGAIAVGSGAAFTSTSYNSLSAVTSGTLTQANSKDNAAIFQLVDVKPGDTLNGYLSITNTGSLAGGLGLTETGSANSFSADHLTLEITDTSTGAVVYDGTFGGLADGDRRDLGVLQPGVKRDFRFTVHLDENAPNTEQGKGASASYTWDAVQLDGVTTDQ